MLNISQTTSTHIKHNNNYTNNQTQRHNTNTQHATHKTNQTKQQQHQINAQLNMTSQQHIYTPTQFQHKQINTSLHINHNS